MVLVCSRKRKKEKWKRQPFYNLKRKRYYKRISLQTEVAEVVKETVTQKTNKTPYFCPPQVYESRITHLPPTPSHHITYPKQTTPYNIFHHRHALPCLEFDETKLYFSFLPFIPILFLSFYPDHNNNNNNKRKTKTCLRLLPKTTHSPIRFHYSTLLTHPQYPITHTYFL